MAWCWLRYQPDSARTHRFNQTTQGTEPNHRGRRIAIVAVARPVAIALWRYLNLAVVLARPREGPSPWERTWTDGQQDVNAIVGGRTAAGPVLYGVRDDGTEQTQSFLRVRLQQTVKRRPRRRCGEIIHTPVRTWLAAITAVAVVVPSDKAGKTCPQRGAAPPWVALPRNESS